MIKNKRIKKTDGNGFNKVSLQRYVSIMLAIVMVASVITCDTNIIAETQNNSSVSNVDATPSLRLIESFDVEIDTDKETETETDNTTSTDDVVAEN